MKLRELRQRYGLTQVELAEILHCRQSAVSAWERGRNDMDLATLVRVADFFGVTTDYLLGRTEDPGPNERFLPAPSIQKKLVPAKGEPADDAPQDAPDAPDAVPQDEPEGGRTGAADDASSTRAFIAALNRSRDSNGVSDEDIRIVEDYIRQLSRSGGADAKGR